MRAASANSNASAMFAARNVFSISFAISAASGARDRVDLRAGVAQDARGALEALLGHAADDARGRLLGVGLDARVDALGGEGDEDVLAGDEAAARERLDEQPARRADRRRRGEDDRLARAGVVDDRVAGAAQRAQVRLAALVDRRRDGDDDRVGGGELGRVGGERERVGVELRGELDLLVVEQLGVAARRSPRGGASEMSRPMTGWPATPSAIAVGRPT